MVKQNFLTKMLLLCALIVGSVSSAWAEEETITAKQFGFTSNTNFEGENATLTATNFTLTFAQNGSTTPPVYNSKSEEFRLYKIASGNTSGATITIAAISENVTFDKVVFEFTNLPNNYSFSSGSYTASTNTWTGDATSSLTLTNTDFSGQLKIKSMTITYQIASSTDPSATLSTTSLDFGEVEVEKTSQKTFTVTPANLTGNLTIASNNGKYTVSPTTIAQDASGAQTITVTAAPTAWDDVMAGTITISGGGLTSNKTVTLTASPYQVANVTLVGDNGTFKVNNEPATSLTFTSRVGNKAAIKAEPNEHYTFTSWAAEGATPESSEIPYQEFTFTAATVTLTATFTEDAKHKATFYVLGAESEIEVYEDDAITFPSVTAPTGYTFMGWTATEITATQATAPADLVTSANMGTSDVEYYAVFAKATEGGDDTYEKLTSNSFETNATYVIGAKGSGTDDNIYYLYSYNNKVDENASWGLVSADLDTNTPITFTLSGTSDALVAKDNSNHYLVGLTTGNFKMSSTSTSVALSSDGSIKNSSSGTYYLRYNTAGGLRWYSSSTGQKAYFYKLIPGTTYSDYSTTVVPENVTITPTKEYVSFSSPYPLDFTNTTGLTAYVVSDETSTSVTLTEVNKVPANTGLVLKGTANTEYTVPVLSGDADTFTNKLKGTGTEGVTVEERSVYVLSDGKFKVYTGTEIAGGKAYLPKTSPAPSLSFDFGEGTTGIQNIERTINDNQYYTLDGRRVAEPTKGLYIINGKKVIIK